MGCRRNPHGIAYFAVAAMMVLLGLQACTVVRAPPPSPPCTPPPGEAQLLADYQSQALLGVLPAVAASPWGWSVVHYCDVDGVDVRWYSTDSAVWVQVATMSGWSDAQLLGLYGPVATQSGWSLDSKTEIGADCGVLIEEGGVPSCFGPGILFCKVIDGVTSDFVVGSSIPRNFNVRIFARRDASNCPNAS
jgi:hypothetical protein